MSTLDDLFANNREWSEGIRRQDPEFFAKLSRQQSPTYLWIGCADSRVPANQITGLEDEVSINAAKRHAENEAVISWFARSVYYRYESYSYALDHLLVETPHEEAISVNGQLSDLAVWVEAAQRGDFCGDHGRGHGRGEIAIRSRLLKSAPDEGPYRK